MKWVILLFLISPLSASAALLDDIQAYWTFEETSGSRADSTANNNDLTDNNTVGYSTGIIGNAADLELANSEYFSITDAAQTGLDFSTDFTANLWVKLESAGSDRLSILQKWGANKSYYWRIPAALTSFEFYSSSDGSSDSSVASDSFTALSVDTWYMFTMSKDATGETRFYIDGTLISVETGSVATLYNNADPFVLGQFGGSFWYDGLMDEMGLWSRELTADEISALYFDGVGCAYPFADECVASSTPTATTTTSSMPYTLSDWLFVENVQIFLMSFICIGMVFSVFKSSKK